MRYQTCLDLIFLFFYIIVRDRSLTTGKRELQNGRGWGGGQIKFYSCKKIVGVGYLGVLSDSATSYFIPPFKITQVK